MSNQSRFLPFGLESSDLNVDNRILKFPLPVNGELTNLEKRVAKQFLNYSKTMRDSSFYTGSFASLKSQVSSDGKVRKMKFDESEGVNDGIKRYSDRFRKKRKIGRSIEEHPYNLQFFPQELYSVMGVDKKKRKMLAISSYKAESDNLDVSGLLQRNEQEKADEMLERLHNMAESLDANGNVINKGDKGEEEEEVIDDEFEEDDDDDYNAERYFNDGDDDEYGDEDNGDDEAAF